VSSITQAITVVGAGPLGRRIACLTAGAGYRTILLDLTGRLLDRAMTEIRLATGPGVLSRIEPERSLDRAATEADFLLETAPDDLETKVEVYTLMDRLARPHCIFAATSRSIPIAEIAALTYRPGRVLGMILEDRFELVRGPATSEETWSLAVQLARNVDKAKMAKQEGERTWTGKTSAWRVRTGSGP